MNNPTTPADLANVQKAFGLADLEGTGIAATPAAIIGKTAAATTDLSGISATAKLTITIDGTAYELNKATLTRCNRCR